MNNTLLTPTPNAQACFALQSRLALPCRMVGVVPGAVAPAFFCGFT